MSLNRPFVRPNLLLVLALVGVGACGAREAHEELPQALDNADPGSGALAVLSVAGINDVRVLAKARHGERIGMASDRGGGGGWLYDANTNRILMGSGRVGGHRFAECFGITSPWGLGAIGVQLGSERFETPWLAPWETKIGTWTLRQSQEISVGGGPNHRFTFLLWDKADGIAMIDFATPEPRLFLHKRHFALIRYPNSQTGINVVPSDRIIAMGRLGASRAWVLRSNARLAIIYEDSVTGEMLAHSSLPWGTQLGSWTVRHNDVVHGWPDGREGFTIIISGEDGLAALVPAGSSFVPIAHTRRGEVISGGWVVSQNDQVSVEPLRYEVSDSFAVRNPNFGRALVTVDGRAFYATAISAWGGFLGNWRVGHEDTATPIATLFDRSQNCQVMQSAWGIGAFRNDLGSSENIFMAPVGTSFLGGWTYRSDDRILSVGDFAYADFGKGFVPQDDILIQHP